MLMNRYSGKGIFRHLLLFCVLAVIFPTAILGAGYVKWRTHT